jgi:hypothetical protein
MGYILPDCCFKDKPLGNILQGFSKVEDPGQSLLRMRGETPTLASHVGNLMQIHQREHHRVEHGEHLFHPLDFGEALTSVEASLDNGSFPGYTLKKEKEYPFRMHEREMAPERSIVSPTDGLRERRSV